MKMIVVVPTYMLRVISPVGNLEGGLQLNLALILLSPNL